MAGAGATLQISDRARDEGSDGGDKVEGKHLGPARLRSEGLGFRQLLCYRSKLKNKNYPLFDRGLA